MQFELFTAYEACQLSMYIVRRAAGQLSSVDSSYQCDFCYHLFFRYRKSH